MSKSLGTVVDPLEAAERLGPDPLRLYLVKEIAVRRRRRLLVGAVRGALQRRPRQQPRQPREPGDDDGRAVSRGEAGVSPLGPGRLAGLAAETLQGLPRGDGPLRAARGRGARRSA